MPLEGTSSNNGAIHCRRTLRKILTYSLAVRKGKKQIEELLHGNVGIESAEDFAAPRSNQPSSRCQHGMQLTLTMVVISRWIRQRMKLRRLSVSS